MILRSTDKELYRDGKVIPREELGAVIKKRKLLEKAKVEIMGKSEKKVYVSENKALKNEIAELRKDLTELKKELKKKPGRPKKEEKKPVNPSEKHSEEVLKANE